MLPTHELTDELSAATEEERQVLEQMFQKTAHSLIEQAIAIHQRAVNDGPMPDQTKLAKELVLTFLRHICSKGRCRKAASQKLILLVRDMMNDMPLNLECAHHVARILRMLIPPIFKSVGLDW
jgi:hypothetical protein